MINQEQIQGNWQQFKGHVKKRWGKLTDDDLMKSEGRTDILIGQLAERYGINKEKATQRWNKFLRHFDGSGNETKSFVNNISGVAENVSDWTFDSIKDCQKTVQEKPLTTIGTATGLATLVGIVIGLFVSKPYKQR